MRQFKITTQITVRNTAFQKYLHDVGEIPLITVEEEVKLAQRIKKGDELALEKLVKANLRFVISVAKQYQHQGLVLADLVNEGNLGLITAANRFDETKGFKFISYAVWWIRQSILQAISEQARVVRLPLNKIGQINKIKKVISELEQKFQREPTIEEISETSELFFEDIREGIQRIRGHASINEPVLDDPESGIFLDIMPSESKTDESLFKESLSEDIGRALATISEREAGVLKHYFGLGCRTLTLEEIGEEINLTRERVRQIKEKAIKKLRIPLRSRLLKSYLG